MCGIVGIAGKNVRKDPDLLRRMRDSLMHRGPDDAGEWWSDDGDVALAMRRLAIIDLTPSGHQPMMDRARECVIVFNGEIYNYKDLRRELESKGHQFSTASDTEVILESYREWKHDCAQRFNGMFAFAIFNLKTREVFLARDRAGEKPLFYLHQDGILWFGSELKSIMVSGRVRKELDWRALDYYLSFGYVPGDQCILKGFAKLLPGHAMTYDIERDNLKAWQYWRLPDTMANDHEDESELSRRFEELLEDSVRRQLVADVPVGIMLSGGVDSSLVTAMAARNSTATVKTFTVTFPGFKSYNEAPYARLVANYFATQHTELEAETVRPEIMVELARQYDEPIADSSMIPTYMLSKLIRRHATVAVGGDGGDELFGGYLHYSMVLKSIRKQRLLPAIFRGPFQYLVQTAIPPGFPYRNRTAAVLSDCPHYVFRGDPYFDNATIARVLAQESDHRVPDKEKKMFNTFGRQGIPYSALQQATSVDFLNYLSSDVLVKVDRASMLVSLEVRSPFLDHRIVEFAFGQVPDRFKATETQRKILLKSTAKRILPKGLDLERKQGFSIPLGDWYEKGWGQFMKEVLYDDAQSLFDKKAIRRLVFLQQKGIFNYQRLYALTMLELWRREYNVSIH